MVKKREPHFVMDDITATWSYPSRDPATKVTLTLTLTLAPNPTPYPYESCPRD